MSFSRLWFGRGGRFSGLVVLASITLLQLTSSVAWSLEDSIRRSYRDADDASGPLDMRLIKLEATGAEVRVTIQTSLPWKPQDLIGEQTRWSFVIRREGRRDGLAYRADVVYDKGKLLARVMRGGVELVKDVPATKVDARTVRYELPRRLIKATESGRYEWFASSNVGLSTCESEFNRTGDPCFDWMPEQDYDGTIEFNILKIPGYEPPPRSLEKSYEEPTLGLVGTWQDCGLSSCIDLRIYPWERFMSLSLTDESGYAVGAAVLQDSNDDGTPEVIATVCGETDEPLPIRPGRDIQIAIGEGLVIQEEEPGEACPSISSQGTVRAVLGMSAKAVQEAAAADEDEDKCGSAQRRYR